ncbi:MAG: tRNA (adenosine(37)-N6)-threonylcarbamoyltransferase complex dimerization subunit type 1 TsaB [Prevotella sp.]|jgi:tRNA threonylcarbamoyladenosine biosynthesis protein TsaB|nr:tRNA (adenosine(37)-N6)-threonylcarbamoyltransferase complex dimerization subunit type 1 TsaB [Prevotella sp.]
MACILHIETSTQACSVAVSTGTHILYEEINTEGPSHASLLGKFVENALTYARSRQLKPDAVAVSCGPGSYTGLRIGVSEAKGLCFGMDLPLIAVNTLKVMASKILKSNQLPDNALLCPMLDARRMEVYAAIFDRQLETVRNTAADIVDEHSYSEYLLQQPVVFFGNGAEKCKRYLTGKNAVFLDGIYPVAADMVDVAEKAFAADNFVNVAYFEPFYLKEFVATVPKSPLGRSMVK